MKNEQASDSKGLAIASMVLGILAIVTFFTIIPPIIMGVLAIIFGVISRKSVNRGMATAGLVTGIIGVVLGLFMITLPFLALPSLQKNASDTVIKTDVGALMNDASNYASQNGGVLPTASNLSTAGLGSIKTVTDSGEPSETNAVYSTTVACNGSAISNRAFSISVKLSDGTIYCQDS